MDNKKLGIIIILFSLVLLSVLFFVNKNIQDAYQAQIDSYIEKGESCPTDPLLCPHQLKAKAQVPIYIGGALILGLLSLGAYLIFFEKSQKEILSTLEKHKQIQTEEEKFNILLKGLSGDEKTIIKAVKEQDGISQQTLRIRIDMHKSKLSIVLSDLEKKGLIKRVEKGKTNLVFLRI